MSTAAPTLVGKQYGVIAAWLTLCAIWGSTWLAIKIGLAQLPPFWFVAIRFAVAASLLFAVCLGRYRIFSRRREDYFFLAGTGWLTFTINYGLLFWGEQHISSGLAAVLQATIPIFGLLFAHFTLASERLQWTKLAGAFLGVAGVAVICSKVLDVQGPLAFRGGLAIIIGAAASAYANVWTKRRGGGFAPAVLAAWQMLFGLGPLVLLAFWREGSPLKLRWTATSLGCLLYLAVVGSSLAFLLYYWLMQRVGVVKLQAIALVVPPVAVLFGWLVAGERLSPWALLGAGFILVGMRLIFLPNVLTETFVT